MNSENYKKRNMHIVSCNLLHMLNSGWKDTDKSDQTKQPWQQQQQQQLWGEGKNRRGGEWDFSFFFYRAGVYGNDIMSILPGYLECYFPIHSHSEKKNGNTLPRVGMNWKIHPPGQFAPFGPRDWLRGRILQYIPSLGCVLVQSRHITSNISIYIIVYKQLDISKTRLLWWRPSTTVCEENPGAEIFTAMSASSTGLSCSIKSIK